MHFTCTGAKSAPQISVVVKTQKCLARMVLAKPRLSELIENIRKNQPIQNQYLNDDIKYIFSKKFTFGMFTES